MRDLRLAALAAALAATIAAAPAGAVSRTNAYCEVKTVSTCTPDGACKKLEQLQGQPLPSRITVDFDNRVISEPYGSGWIKSAHIGTYARAGGQTILHGIDGPFAWQMMILEKERSMSYVAATADVSVSAFGTCSETP